MGCGPGLHIYIHTYIYIYIYICVCVYVYMHMYIYIVAKVKLIAREDKGHENGGKISKSARTQPRALAFVRFSARKKGGGGKGGGGTEGSAAKRQGSQGARDYVLAALGLSGHGPPLPFPPLCPSPDYDCAQCSNSETTERQGVSE